MKFRNGLVVIEAVQHFADMGTYTAVIPHWLITACSVGDVFCEGRETYIKTIEGKMHVADGDWILRGVNGELRACKSDIFEKTYEPVTD